MNANAVPPWLEDMVNKMHRRSEPQYVRENVRATLLNIQDYLRENLEQHDRNQKLRR